MGRRIRAEREHRPRRFRGDAGEFDRAMPHAGPGFEPSEALADKLEIRRAVGLWDENRVEAGLDDSGEVVGGKSGVERIDAHEAGPGAALVVRSSSATSAQASALSRRRDRNFRGRGSAHRRRSPARGRTCARSCRGRREASAISCRVCANPGRAGTNCGTRYMALDGGTPRSGRFMARRMPCSVASPGGFRSPPWMAPTASRRGANRLYGDELLGLEGTEVVNDAARAIAACAPCRHSGRAGSASDGRAA